LKTSFLFLAASVVFGATTSTAFAGPFRHQKSTFSQKVTTTTTTVTTAQDSANFQARRNRLGHCGNPAGGFEGVGCGATPAQALANCCRSAGVIVDQGVAQGPGGLWFATIRRR